MYHQVEVNEKLIQKLKEVEKILKIEMDGIKKLTKSVAEAFYCCKSKQSENALNGIEKALNIYKLQKSKCLSIVGAEDVSLSIINKVIETQQLTKEACYERGKHYFYNGNPKLALIDFNNYILAYPNDQKVQNLICLFKKIQLTVDLSFDMTEKNNYMSALQTLTVAFPLIIKNDVITAGMYYRRALVAHAAKYIPQALSDVTQAIKIKPNFLKAIVMRAEIFLTIGSYQRCLIDCARAQKIQLSERITRMQKYSLEKIQGAEEVHDVYLTSDAVTTSSNTNNLYNIFSRIKKLMYPDTPSVQQLPIEVLDPTLLHFVPGYVYNNGPSTLPPITPVLASCNSIIRQEHLDISISQ